MTTWTSIASTDTDQDSSIDETLMDAIRGNLDYLKEHLLKSRSTVTYLDAASPTEISSQGVPIVVARGYKAWSGTTDGTDGFVDIPVTVTFSSDAADGDPGFDSGSTIHVVLALAEITTGGGTAFPVAGVRADQNIGVFMDSGQPTYTGFTATISINDFTNSTLYKGNLHWFAFGDE